MRSIVCFTGNNAFALTEKLKFWKREFMTKHGEHNCITLESNDVTKAGMLDALSGMPFLGEKRLIISLGIPKFSKEDMQEVCQTTPHDTILLFIEPNPDKRLGGTKELLKIATVHVCNLLSEKELRAWGREFLEKRQRTITETAWQTMLRYTGNNQGHIASELEKLSLFVKDTITEEHVHALGVPVADEQLQWELTSILQKQELRHSVAFLELLFSKGEDAHRLWNTLLWMLRSLITITWEKDLSKSSMRMHPHTARALRSLSTKLADRLPHIAAFALSTEKAVKTGEIRTEQTKTIELECAITLLVSLLSGENLKKSS